MIKLFKLVSILVILFIGEYGILTYIELNKPSWFIQTSQYALIPIIAYGLMIIFVSYQLIKNEK